MLFSNHLTATLTLTTILLVGMAVMTFTWYEIATMRARSGTLAGSKGANGTEPRYVYHLTYQVIRFSVEETEANGRKGNKDLFISEKVKIDVGQDKLIDSYLETYLLFAP